VSAHVAYSATTNGPTNLPVFAQDLGHELVMSGWAKPKSGGENANYMAKLASAADNAAYQPQGMYAPPCGNPKVYGDDNGNGVTDSEEDVDVDVDVDANVDTNTPHRPRDRSGGSGKGRFCRKHWWC
jgi:hypothetical protein